jgi:hypothetical protein
VLGDDPGDQVIEKGEEGFLGHDFERVLVDRSPGFDGIEEAGGIGGADFGIGEGIEGELNVVAGDVDAVLPCGVLVQVECVGLAVRGDLPRVGEAIGGGLPGAKVPADEWVVEQVDDLNGVRVLGEEGVDGLDVAQVGVDKGPAGGRRFAELHLFEVAGVQLLPCQ